MEKISILVLDFVRPRETKCCLESIQEFCHFEKEVIYYSNGGYFDYPIKFLEEGLADQLIVNRKNIGGGLATIDLFNIAKTKYAIYLQCDQFFHSLLTQQAMNDIVVYLESNPDVKGMSFSGFPAGGQRYTERCHLTNVEFYRQIPKVSTGGPGPNQASRYLENVIQSYYEDNEYKFHMVKPPVITDVGKWSVRQFPCGGIIAFRCDTKTTYVITPPLEKYGEQPPFTDEEWDLVFGNKWPDGKVPKDWEEKAFTAWPGKDELDFIEYLRGNRIYDYHLNGYKIKEDKES